MSDAADDRAVLVDSHLRAASPSDTGVQDRRFDLGQRSGESVSITDLWNQEFDLAAREIQAWRSESLSNKYVTYFAAQNALMIGEWTQAKALLDEAIDPTPEDPLITSLSGVYWALIGNTEQALECVTRACSSAKSFAHAPITPTIRSLASFRC